MKKKRNDKMIKLIVSICIILLVGLLIPENIIIPVHVATYNDWNHNSFWYYPWGKSVVHKGIDIFAAEGTPIYSATDGISIYSGNYRMGGNIIMILGPKWHVHYYAHMKKSHIGSFKYVRKGQIIGEVGTSGNAKGKPAHLHYSILSPIPSIWKATLEHQGYLKIFFINPHERLTDIGI